MLDFDTFQNEPSIEDLRRRPATSTEPASPSVQPPPAQPPIRITEPAPQLQLQSIPTDAAPLPLTVETGQLSGAGFPQYAQRDQSFFAFEPAFPEWDNLVDIWYTMYPDIELYPWQAQELLRISGYIEGRLDGPRVHFDPHQAFRAAYVTVNGSGKDMVLIATTAIGLPLLYKNTYIVITSSSHAQLKYQTSRHIENGIKQLNKTLGFKVYDSVEFYHRCEARGGEIKLFVTDEAGRAEGWHPMHPRGRLVIIVNEAKSITPEVFTALSRCSGYSHWLEVSSPGSRRGLFYSNHTSAITYPNIPAKGKFFTRKVHQKECPHKSEEDRIEFLRRHGLNSYAYQTSVLCNFWEEETLAAIPASLVEAAKTITPIRNDNDIGIGVDVAAGGDETVGYVRAGATVIHRFAFRDPDLTATVERIDTELQAWKRKPYTAFNFDDNGLGKGPADMLIKLNWNLTRISNQQRARDTVNFLNIGAEMYAHVKRLFEHGYLARPDDELLIEQLVTRKYRDTESQAKKALESKKQAGNSPDRADAYVLCFFSYRPDFQQTDPLPAQKRLMTTDEFLAAYAADPDFVSKLVTQHSTPKQAGDFTFQTFKP